MNNESLSSFINELIYVENLITLQLYFLFSSLAILLYTSFLSLPDEINHIWKPKFTLPAYLYLFAKYPLFFSLALLTVVGLAQLPLHQCGVVTLLAQILQTLSFFGIQGLVLIRTYSLSQGYRPIIIALSITFLTTSAIQIYELTLPLCSIGLSSLLSNPAFFIPSTVKCAAIILLDTLAFITVIRQVWELWRVKRHLGLRNNDFLSSLLQQGTISFCFILFMTTAQIFLNLFAPIVITISVSLQVTISALIICNFTLDLRRRNTNKSVPNQYALSLPTLSLQENPVQSIRTVLGQLHESIVAEMGETNDPPASAMDIDGPGSVVPGDLENNLDDVNPVTNEDQGESQGVAVE